MGLNNRKSLLFCSKPGTWYSLIQHLQLGVFCAVVVVSFLTKGVPKMRKHISWVPLLPLEKYEYKNIFNSWRCMAWNFKGLCLFFYLFVTEPIFCEAVYRIRLAILPVKTFDSAGVSFPYPVPDHRKPLCKNIYDYIQPSFKWLVGLYIKCNRENGN